jgi:hypothetical protein
MLMDCWKTSFLLVSALSLPLAACDFEMPDDDGAAESDAGSEDESGGAGDEESGGAVDESSEGGVDETGDPGAAIPAELLGLWVIPGSTAAAGIAFAEDGTYARVNVGELPGGSCTTTIQILVDGEFVVSDDVVALHPTAALKTTDMCGSVTEDSSLPADEELTWEVGQDQWGEALVLTDSTGYAAVYHRE